MPAPEKTLWSGLSLAQQFAVVSLAVILAGMLIVGWWISREIEQRVTQSTGTTTALFTNSFLAPQLQELADRDTLSGERVEALTELLRETPLGKRIVSIKIWGPDGRVIYSSQGDITDQVFPASPALTRAWQGEVVSELSSLSDDENAAERQLGKPLLETYSPVRHTRSGRVIAVAEFYELATHLQQQLHTARIGAWLVMAGAALAIFLSLFGIVRRGSQTIEAQQADLHAHIAELSTAAQYNAELHEKVRLASRQATELNERFLRRISTELHDGPAQYVGFALLRLDALRTSSSPAPDPLDHDRHDAEFDRVRASLGDALREIRDICSGMALPELDSLSLRDAIARAVRAHERKTDTRVDLQFGALPETASTALKICLYRLVQEALNNAFVHGGGAGQKVAIAVQQAEVDVRITDAGKGFTKSNGVEVSGRLGIIGMKRRVEEFGGDFTMHSTPGHGTTIIARIPLTTMEYSGA